MRPRQVYTTSTSPTAWEGYKPDSGSDYGALVAGFSASTDVVRLPCATSRARSTRCVFGARWKRGDVGARPPAAPPARARARRAVGWVGAGRLTRAAEGAGPALSWGVDARHPL